MSPHDAPTIMTPTVSPGAPPPAEIGGETTTIPAWQAPTNPPPSSPPEGVSDTLIIGAGQQPMGAPPPVEELGAQGELMIESGPDTGHTYRLASTALRVGRSPDNDLILRDPATSGHHARLERRGSQFFIVDLGSTNGTLVNGEPVQEKELKHGDRITIGQNAVKFSLL
jgi:pSer/pThr/pTyr-binding forkhead associated (FHA) protein